MLIGFSEEQKLPEVGTVTAEDQMDDGTPIRVRVQQTFTLSATSAPVTPSSTRDFLRLLRLAGLELFPMWTYLQHAY